MGRFIFSSQQARQFLLWKQGLLGAYRFSGRSGVLAFVRQAGCIQYDPIDICGKNAELVLQSRVAGFSKQMLSALLYEERELVDYFDKNMAIFHVEDWKYFARMRAHHHANGRSRDAVEAAIPGVIRTIQQKGFVCSKDIQLPQTVDWSWSPTSLSRAVLETLYFRGALVIHHKKGTQKYYSLAEAQLPAHILETPDPNESEDAFLAWQVQRRIGSVGMLWNRPSDAWLGIDGLKSEVRTRIFSALAAAGRIVEWTVEGIGGKLYILKEDEALAAHVLSGDNVPKRLEFIAPLDNLLWDRKLIKALFNFDYKWEIYTPVTLRKYGYYVLPVLYGDRFAGRAEVVADRKQSQLVVRQFWPEADAGADDNFRVLFAERLRQFAAFNDCDTLRFEPTAQRWKF